MLASSRWFRAGWALGSIALVGACSGKSSDDGASSPGGSGGTSGSSSGSGGTSGSGGSGTVSNQCDSFTACGGDVVGSWKLANICNDMGIAAIPGADCATTKGTPTFNSDATFDFKSDGSYSVQGSIQFSAELSYDDACAMSTLMQSASEMCATLNASSAAAAQLGYSVSCSLTGKLCDCQFSATVPQDSTGSYTVDGDSITVTAASSNGKTTTTSLNGTSEFCVDGSTVTVKASDGTVTTLTK